MTEKTCEWTDKHEQFCYQNRIPNAAKVLWQWLLRQGELASEIEPDLSEFNDWVEKWRGKKYSHHYLKKMFILLVECRVIGVLKQFCWKIYRIIVKPLEWLEPPKKREKKLRLSNSSYNSQPLSAESSVAGNEQQQHSNICENQALLADTGVHYDESQKEVLDRPTNEIKIALALFEIRGGFDKIQNPEGWIRACLTHRYWESQRNYNLLLAKFGNLTTWNELFPDTTNT